MWTFPDIDIHTQLKLKSIEKNAKMANLMSFLFSLFIELSARNVEYCWAINKEVDCDSDDEDIGYQCHYLLTPLLMHESCALL